MYGIDGGRFLRRCWRLDVESVVQGGDVGSRSRRIARVSSRAGWYLVLMLLWTTPEEMHDRCGVAA